MFCGWRLVNSYHAIESLGSGNLFIDALTEKSTFNGVETEPLAIAGELRHWLITDLKSNNIALDAIVAAELSTTIDLTKTNWKARTTRDHWFDHKGAEIVWRKINRCVIECNSIVRTSEAEYRSYFQDVEEWPEGFPAT